MKLKVTAFLVICFCIGYFGVQKFDAKKLIVLGSGLFTAGALTALVQSLDPKKKTVKRKLN
ncbi:MAG TPA: hypothetical protein VE956_00040 [Nodularia sp. (in: cyanobacteria)]|nr:hypothetical protein [Nodularia sp. (in: cyanobacteria)]